MFWAWMYSIPSIVYPVWSLSTLVFHICGSFLLQIWAPMTNGCVGQHLLSAYSFTARMTNWWTDYKQLSWSGAAPRTVLHKTWSAALCAAVWSLNCHQTLLTGRHCPQRDIGTFVLFQLSWARKNKEKTSWDWAVPNSVSSHAKTLYN